MKDALIVIEELDTSLVFSENGMTKLLKDIETKAISHVPDITTEQGRKDIVSLAYKVTRSKTLIDNLGKDIVSEWKKKAKEIDAHRKIAREFLDNLKDKVKQPLTIWEEKQAQKKIEEERLEKIKISERVDVLFKVNMNIPYFDAAMLSDDEFFTMLDEATNKYNIERLRLQKEQKAKEEEEKRLADEKAAQEAEAKRLADIQAAQEAKAKELKDQQEAIAKEQADKEAELKAQAKAIEDERNAEAERKEREAFEKKTYADAKIQAEKDRKREKEERINRVKENREKALKNIEYLYPHDDLGKMPDKKYFKLLDKHQAIWNTKQSKLLAEKLEKERIEKEKAEAIEKARKAELAPDKQKIIDLAMTIRQIISPPAIKNKAAKEIVHITLYELSIMADNLVNQAEEL